MKTKKPTQLRFSRTQLRSGISIWPCVMLRIRLRLKMRSEISSVAPKAQ